MRFLLFTLAIVVLISCKKDEEDVPCTPDNYLFYSDYFVFVADDGDSPLVIPMDVNWNPTDSGYRTELKSWYGTTNEWPIAYTLTDTVTDLCEVPQEAWEHCNTNYFQFNESTREIISTIWGAPELRLTIPEQEHWVKTQGNDNILIYGCKTIAKVDGSTRSGWLIYERIRREQGSQSFGDFEAFYWLPLVIDGNFYHFEQHKDEQMATRWTENNGIVEVSTIPSFNLNILGVSSDPVSGRENIPDTLQVLAPEWNIDISMVSTGSQVGHGPEFPNGLAYYRQSLLESLPGSVTSGYGMLELILEND